MSRLMLIIVFAGLSIAMAGIPPLEDQKMVSAAKFDGSINLDGQLNEEGWKSAQSATNFIEHSPFPGIPASDDTEVRLLYDDFAIYIGAYMHTADPSTILKEYTLRDAFGNADYFGFMVDAYQDGINALVFYVTAAGVQLDSKISALGQDYGWNAVWASAVHINDDGWSVELMIPYSAIRFPDVDVQKWNANFVRLVRETRQLSYWNPVDPEINGLINQAGQIDGIRDIKPPVRLSATPFVVNAVEHNSNLATNKWQNSFSGGMDIKYGISDAFTLDMTLIPDFSQARSDDQVLNLSPFEIQFNENRQFFTEGTELFNKGGLFYSRRIGGRPIDRGRARRELEDSEVISDNPSSARLINATKISGRNSKGTGLGFFNGVTANTYATLTDTISEETRRVLTDPATNYNVLVFDQNLGNNSYFTILNTNVLRAGSYLDANVTGAQFELFTEDNKWGIRGGGAYSARIQDKSNLDGYRWNVNLGKRSGAWVYNVGAWIVSDTYDHNDLGFLRSGNEANFSLDISYRIFEPKGIFQRISTSFEFDYQRLFRPSRYNDLDLELSIFGLARTNEGMRIRVQGSPIDSRDYFEPRTSDFSRYYRFPKNMNVDALFSSNYNKKLAIDFRGGYRFFDARDRHNIYMRFGSRYRFSDKFNLSLGVVMNNRARDEGFVFADPSSNGFNTLLEEDILFGNRDRETLEFNLDFRYVFNENMGFTFRSRHYWSRVEYNKFGTLDQRGRLAKTDYKGRNEDGKPLHNNNFNAFNIDLIYTWRYAPGSDIIFVWKNQILQNGDEIILNYFENVDQLVQSPQINNLSLKVVYFLDYLYLKKQA